MAKRSIYRIVAERPNDELVLYGTSHRQDYAEDLARALSKGTITRQVAVVKGTKIKSIYHNGCMLGRNYVGTLSPSEYRR